ncbi:DUF559 domain-containing protein [Sphingosinicella sp. YJ22]|uniref:endonuclease domain-containing protein n=1 Tax=Sphingosinicella sp. YJ22 TaxID=1104780 RepID=UPI001407C0B3|nr:DUF559 domain-containing protein [Sphingosinicella sp. YJ22]
MRDQLLIQRAKQMRRQPTEPERLLWSALRARRLDPAKFRRQVVIGSYVVDFACRIPTKLIIEIDGDSHDFQQEYDAGRTKELEARGYRVLRFTNAEMMTNLGGVVTSIAEALASPPLPVSLRSTTLSPEGERGQKGS